MSLCVQWSESQIPEFTHSRRGYYGLAVSMAAYFSMIQVNVTMSRSARVLAYHS